MYALERYPAHWAPWANAPSGHARHSRHGFEAGLLPEADDGVEDWYNSPWCWSLRRRLTSGRGEV